MLSLADRVLPAVDVPLVIAPELFVSGVPFVIGSAEGMIAKEMGLLNTAQERSDQSRKQVSEHLKTFSSIHHVLATSRPRLERP